MKVLQSWGLKDNQYNKTWRPLIAQKQIIFHFLWNWLREETVQPSVSLKAPNCNLGKADFPGFQSWRQSCCGKHLYEALWAIPDPLLHAEEFGEPIHSPDLEFSMVSWKYLLAPLSILRLKTIQNQWYITIRTDWMKIKEYLPAYFQKVNYRLPLLCYI